MAEFVQIVRFHTDAGEEQLKEMNQAYRSATAGRATHTSVVVGRDLDSGEYVIVATFPSKDAADENNALPETAANAEAMRAISSGVSFSNIEVIERM